MEEGYGEMKKIAYLLALFIDIFRSGTALFMSLCDTMQIYNSCDKKNTGVKVQTVFCCLKWFPDLNFPPCDFNIGRRIMINIIYINAYKLMVNRKVYSTST